MKSIKDMTQSEIAAFVQSRLRENGIDVVLSGGAYVAIYTSNKYVSLDLDMIEIYPGKKRLIRDSMNKRDFTRRDAISSIQIRSLLSNFPKAPLR